MKLIGEVHRFNTGRRYASDGQPIAWGIVEDANGVRVVTFIDYARGIFGTVPLFVGNLDLIDDRWVLRAYDDHHYRSDYITYSWFVEVARD